MAEREIYRVEIPIIVDDQTDAPLKQAERKISKFEKSAQKETEKIRKHFQHIAKYQIEPIMKVRDQLTANVLKADKLIRKLDVAQASPLIAAQDRVSAVITRINAMLDALDKGKVDVVAEMQGPLLDEILKAKKSLSELNNVKAGPIAELRGQLFGQLTKAMSQIKGLDLARAEPQATLRERVTWKVREVSSSLRGLTSRAWTVTLEAKDKVTSTIKSILNKLTSPLALLGAGTGLGAGIVFPLKLAGEMEQAGIAMEFFTESAAKGQKFLKELQTFAAKTPFEFPDVRDAAVGLMPIYKQMYGVDEAMKQTMRTIAAFGDAAGLTGAGIQGMNLALLGFRQIGTIGKLSMEELRQVTENLLIPMNIILDELGLTGDALDNLAKEGIEAKVAMEAIVRALEKNFAGGMEKMSKSLLGLTATIKDTASLTVWHFGAGMAEPVKRVLFDIVGLTDETGGKFEEFQRRLERAGEQVGLKFEQMYEGVKQFFSDLTSTPGFNEMTWSEKVTVALDKILESVSAWLEGPGGEAIKKTGEFLGSLLAAGLEGAIPNIIPVAVNLGLALGKGILSGIWQTLSSNPIVGGILGALGGAKVGAMAGTVGGLPGAAVGGIGGAIVGGGAAFIKRLVSKKHQYGGILTRPHIGLVAEAGPEAIIPLSARMRSRALSLYEETGRWLGVRPYAEGGFVGSIPAAAPAVAGLSASAPRGSISVTNYINVSVGGSNADPDEIAEAIAIKLQRVYNNMP